MSRFSQHDRMFFGNAEPHIALVVNNPGTAIGLANPAIFYGLNSTGNVEVAYATNAGTVPGGNTFAQEPDRKVLGFPQSTIAASTTEQIVVYSGIVTVNCLGTITAGGFMKWAATAGVGGRMGEASSTDLGKIRGFWCAATNSSSPILAFVLPWAV